MGIEPTGAAEGVSVAVLKTGQTTRPDPLPSDDGGRLATPCERGSRCECVARKYTAFGCGQGAAIASISTRAPRGSAATATVERAGRWSPKAPA